MSDDIQSQIMVLFLQFCRVGGCMMFAPGFSSPRIPMQIRLLVAFAATAAIAPLLNAKNTAIVFDQAVPGTVFMILQELMIGSSIGLMARMFLLALQFSATAISNFVGLTGVPGIPLEEGDTGSPLATLASAAAVTIIFAVGLHIELLKGIIDSYAVIPLGTPFQMEAFLQNLLRSLSETWMLALRLSGPFVIYGIIVNLALGLGNRFVQQVSVYHATTGAVMLGGFLLFYLVWFDWIMMFVTSYRSWLVQGGF